MFATVTVAVCHCGAGCLLGDIVGEWLVYGTHATINGHHLWVSFLVGMYAPPWGARDASSTRSLSANFLGRLRLCSSIWHCLSVFFNCSYVRGIWPRHNLARFEGRLFVFDLIPGGPLRMDGYIPDSYLELQSSDG